VSPTARKKKEELIPVSKVEVEAASRIITVRGQRVVLDSDLAEFYGVETKALNRQVARNADRFPEDFSFHLTPAETASLKRQNGTASWGGRRTSPRVFTEQGALAASAVLRSERAAEVSVAVSRAFVAMRDHLAELESRPALVEFAARVAKLEEHSTQQTEFNEYVRGALSHLDSFIELVEGQRLGASPAKKSLSPSARPVASRRSDTRRQGRTGRT